jgi:hypothetical protein
MSPDALKAWIKQRGLSHQEAADLLAMSRDGLRKNLYGTRLISPQTEMIICLLDKALAEKEQPKWITIAPEARKYFRDPDL